MANSHYLFCKISVQKQRWHEILWFLLRTLTLGVRVLLPLGWNTCLPINFDIENFGWKTCEVEKGGIILLIFSCGGAFNVGGWGLVRLVLYTSLQLQILCTYSLPTLYIYSTSDRRRIWNPVEHLRWRFFAEIVSVKSRTSAVKIFCRNSQRVKAVGYFWRRAPSCIFDKIFDRILNTTLPSNSL